MRRIIIIVFMAGIITGYVFFSIHNRMDQPVTAQDSGSERFDRTVQVVQKTIHSVVNISTQQTIQRNPFYPSDRFSDFWNFFYPHDYEAKSLGSGVIINKEGYILTNEHIILSAESVITVTLADGREYTGTLIKSSPRFDLALVKIGEKGDVFPTIPLGNSDALMVGETVLAIGSPYSFSESVTRGIVSAKNRTIRNEKTLYRGLIQTDASINPGNSGGPLLNMDGEVVGINSAIYSQSGGSVGIGFAIPINKASRILYEFLQHGEVQPIYLGIKIQNLDRRLARRLEVSRGVIVTSVAEDSPGAIAGIETGDVIISIDRERISDTDDYFSVIHTFTVTETITMGIIRDGKSATASIKPVELTVEKADHLIWDLLGIRIMENTMTNRLKYQIRTKDGVIVEKVKKGSYLYDIRLKPGHVIYKLNQVPVNSVNDFRKTFINLCGNEAIFLYIDVEGRPYRVSVALY